MRESVRFTRTQDKRASLTAHYGLFRQLFGKKFPESNFVPGDGLVDSDIVFVGEAPGALEDAAKKPFVGKSGEYLDKLLKTVDIKRGDIFITNFLHYRPPNNRDPKGEEIPVCEYMLRQELKILNPKVVVTLGRFSAGLFWDQPHMGTITGQLWVRRGFTVVPLYHPATALYDTSGNQDALMRQHIKTVGDIFHGTARLPLTKSRVTSGTNIGKSPLTKS